MKVRVTITSTVELTQTVTVDVDDPTDINEVEMRAYEEWEDLMMDALNYGDGYSEENWDVESMEVIDN